MPRDQRPEPCIARVAYTPTALALEVSASFIRRSGKMLARFFVGNEERETRDVSEQWLNDASANHDNILLKDGNTYCVSRVSYLTDGGERHARVDVEAPQFARGS